MGGWEPWVPIDRAEAAAALADRLAVEVGPGHPLHAVPVQAVGRRADRDDVLYRLLDGTGRVAVVHLTWTGSPPERPPYPWATLYPSIEAWAERMAAELADGAVAGVEGWVEYPPPFGVGPYVRPAFPADRDEWVRMRTALWPEDPAEHPPEVDEYLAGRRAGSPATTATFVAVRPAGGLCGFVEASVRPWAEGCGSGPVGYVEGWWVDPDVRRRGVGRLLVGAAERWAAGRGCAEMASDALLDNHDSHAAHRALGFEEVERVVLYRKAVAEWAGGSPRPGRGEGVGPPRPIRPG